jgi:hypothetical protein
MDAFLWCKFCVSEFAMPQSDKNNNLVTISQMRDLVSPIYFLIDFDEGLFGALVKQQKM